MSANIAVCILGWWRCFANNYLHWAAVCTWLLLSAQGKHDIYTAAVITNPWHLYYLKPIMTELENTK